MTRNILTPEAEVLLRQIFARYKREVAVDEHPEACLISLLQFVLRRVNDCTSTEVVAIVNLASTPRSIEKVLLELKSRATTQ